MKYCKDCKHYDQPDDKYAPRCSRPKKREYDTVTGRDITVQYFCSTERTVDWFTSLLSGFCGKGAKHFEKK
jgi:hypothetical protein